MTTMSLTDGGSRNNKLVDYARASSTPSCGPQPGSNRILNSLREQAALLAKPRPVEKPVSDAWVV
jgi:hypothetical protein